MGFIIFLQNAKHPGHNVKKTLKITKNRFADFPRNVVCADSKWPPSQEYGEDYGNGGYRHSVGGAVDALGAAVEGVVEGA